MDLSRLQTTSLQSSAQGVRVARILSTAIEAIEPGAALQRFMKVQTEATSPDGRLVLSIGKKYYFLDEIKRIFVVGAGKAGAPMVRSASQILGARIHGGMVIVKEGYAGGVTKVGPVSILEAGHPLPDERGVAGAKGIIELLRDTREGDLVISLFSGGGSALLVSPAGDLCLSDLQRMTEVLLRSGASIDEINTLRKHLEQLKGGQLARLASPAQTAALILSDVVGDRLDVIASGPTVPDPSTFDDSIAILERYRIHDQVPEAIVKHLRRGQAGEIPETPKPGDPIFSRVDHSVIGSNLQAAEAALRQAESEGFNVLLLSTYLQGEAREAGRMLAAIARQIAADGRPVPRPACLVIGGETTVTIQGQGKGGRNQELALSAVPELAGLPQTLLVTLATDGGDGPTDAAGAVVTGETLARARQAGLDPVDSLAKNDAYHFFQALGDLLKPGPTQTNVNDLAFLFSF
jgi:glycerate 2-kinase